jgi:hypothetical protein
MRKVFRIGDTLQVFKLGTTTNEKIVDSQKEKIVQSYTFSRKQFELLSTGTNDGMKTFFSNADSNCLDCPFNKFGSCYTHKFNQYVGFVSMLKSIARQYPTFESIPSEYDIDALIKMATNRYVRFGTYGECSLHPQEVIEGIAAVSKSWTGYTHQWKNYDLGNYFMASVHSKEENIVAGIKGYRSFIVSDEKQDVVNCPASKESGYKSSCNKCNLCSGLLGTKSKKSVYILTH